MDENRLDGNAAGGILGEIFPFEMTSAQTACANCGSVWRVGQTMVYMHGMGAIVRCATCDNALIRLAHSPDRYWLDMRGVRYLQVGDRT
jgi:Family of unknown function (DUF6510)